MRITAVIALVFAAHLLCASAQAASPDPIRIVQAKFAAFNRHDASAIESLYASDAVLQSPDHAHLVGNSKIALTYQQLFDAIPDAKDIVVQLDRAMNRVYAQFVLTGHFNGAEKAAVNIRILSVYTIENQRIISDTTYYDRKM